MQPILTIAMRAAESAADKLNYTINNIANLTADGSTDKEVFDKAIEDAAWRARKAIRAAHPKHHIDSVQIGLEESRDWDGQSHWMIDVAIGEANLRSGDLNALISVALYTKGKIDCLAWVNPVTEEHLTCSKGRGVIVNGKRMRAQVVPLANAIVGVETNRVELITHWHENAAGIRITGCALANVFNQAAGRVDISVNENMAVHEMEAAMLIAQELGALTGDASAKPVKIEQGSLIIAAPKTFKQALSKG